MNEWKVQWPFDLLMVDSVKLVYIGSGGGELFTVKDFYDDSSRHGKSFEAVRGLNYKSRPRSIFANIMSALFLLFYLLYFKLKLNFYFSCILFFNCNIPFSAVLECAKLCRSRLLLLDTGELVKNQQRRILCNSSALTWFLHLEKTYERSCQWSHVVVVVVVGGGGGVLQKITILRA